MTQFVVYFLILIGQCLGNATGYMHEGTFFSKAEATSEHENHAKYFTNVGAKTEHILQIDTCHDGSHLRDSATCSLGANILDTGYSTSSEKHAEKYPPQKVLSSTNFELVDCEDRFVDKERCERTTHREHSQPEHLSPVDLTSFILHYHNYI